MEQVTKGLLAGACFFALLYTVAHAGRQSLDGFSVDVPAGWSASRGAASDGQLGMLLEAPSISGGEESFVFYTVQMPYPEVEATARSLQQQMLATGRPVKPVDEVRSFNMGKRPAIRAELVGSDPYSGENARVIYWVIARDTLTALVFRAILLETRFHALAPTLETMVRSIKFVTAYSGPSAGPRRAEAAPGSDSARPSSGYDPEKDVWTGTTAPSRDYTPPTPAESATPEPGYDPVTDTWRGTTGDVYGEDSSGSGDVEVERSETPMPREPVTTRPISAGEIAGNFCSPEEEGFSIQFDGKGQWARRRGAPPEKFSVEGVPPADSGTYRIVSGALLLDSYLGETIRCRSTGPGNLACQGGDQYEKAACR